MKCSKACEATPGNSLQLTLDDLDLQAVAELALEGQRGAVVAPDPRTGEVLADGVSRAGLRSQCVRRPHLQ